MTNEIIRMIIIVLTTMVASSIIMIYMKKIAVLINATDKPRSEEGNRHIHKKEMPKLGGVGIYLAFLLGYMLFGKYSHQMNSILIGSFIVILTGIIDDIESIGWKKIIGQLIAAFIVVFYGGLLLDKITAFGYIINFGFWAYPLTIIFIIACMNIINLIDGIDGLSGGISSIFYLTMGIICFLQGRFGTLEILLCFIMLGSTLGFLIHNFYPASIFAGDCTTFQGYMIAMICLLGFKGPALTSFFVPILILAIPILDTLFAIIRRLLRKQPIFSADKEHIHYQLINMNFSQRTTVLIIYVINILFSLASIFYMLKNSIVSIIIYIILFITVIWFVLNTSILSNKIPEKRKIIEKKVKKKLKRV